jgi:hypothetical protein
VEFLVDIDEAAALVVVTVPGEASVLKAVKIECIAFASRFFAALH